MSDKPPCRYFNPNAYEWGTLAHSRTETCAHPLLAHMTGAASSPIKPGTCHGCPCHEPAQEQPGPLAHLANRREALSKKVLWSIITGALCSAFWGLASWHYIPNAIPKRILITCVITFFLFGGLYYLLQNKEQNHE